MEQGFSMLWTALPMELVLEDQVTPVPQCVDLIQEGRTLQVLPLGDGAGVIQRLVSTNPQDYLDPRWQPGVRVPLV